MGAWLQRFDGRVFNAAKLRFAFALRRHLACIAMSLACGHLSASSMHMGQLVGTLRRTVARYICPCVFASVC